MSVSKQKELNLLITAPQVLGLSTGDDSLKNKVTVEEPSVQDNHVCEIKPQPQPQLEQRRSSKNNLGQSVAPQVQIKWGPQVSHITFLTQLFCGFDRSPFNLAEFLNICRDTAYSDRGFSWFSPLPAGNFQDINSTKPLPLPS
jgi:hypothetical protein